MISLQLVYGVNIIIVGWVSFIHLFFPTKAHQQFYKNIFTYSEAFRLLGALYMAIFLLSIVGLWLPKAMSLVLVYQLIYKTAWLLFAALPAIAGNRSVPKVMTAIFIIYVSVLPFIIPWKYIFIH